MQNSNQIEIQSIRVSSCGVKVQRWPSTLTLRICIAVMLGYYYCHYHYLLLFRGSKSRPKFYQYKWPISFSLSPSI